ncbi:hypothetical protein Tco_1143849 [Tanacetum coccineum]
MRDTIAQTRSENVSKLSNGPLLTETSQAQEITSLKKRVKRLEKKGGSRTHKLKRLYKVGLSRRVESSKEESLGEEDASKQGRIADIDADTGINLVSTSFDADIDMFGVHDLVGDEKDQLMLDEELAFKLQAEEEEEERLAIEKAQQIEEVNIAWDDVQARVELLSDCALRTASTRAEEFDG